MKIKRLAVHNIFRVIILAAALFCWVCALMMSGDMVKGADSVSLRYMADGVPSTAVERMLAEESVPFAVWRQKDSQTVTEPAFSREAVVNMLEVAGDAELVIPNEELLAGFLPVRDSMDTCAIDAATAYALWGGMDVAGEILLYCGAEYLVTGVYEKPESTVLLQSAPKSDTAYPYLEISVSGASTTGRQSREFISRYSLSEPDILTDNVETAAILRQLALLPALVASALLLWRSLRRIFTKPALFSGRACFVAAMAVGIFLMAWAIGFSLVLSVAIIPGRWSDFSFWVRLMESSDDRVNLSRAFHWPVPDIFQWYRQRSLFFFIGGALTGCVVGLWRESGAKEGGNIQDDIDRTKEYI